MTVESFSTRSRADQPKQLKDGNFGQLPVERYVDVDSICNRLTGQEVLPTDTKLAKVISGVDTEGQYTEPQFYSLDLDDRAILASYNLNFVDGMLATSSIQTMYQREIDNPNKDESNSKINLLLTTEDGVIVFADAHEFETSQVISEL